MTKKYIIPLKFAKIRKYEKMDLIAMASERLNCVSIFWHLSKTFEISWRKPQGFFCCTLKFIPKELKSGTSKKCFQSFFVSLNNVWLYLSHLHMRLYNSRIECRYNRTIDLKNLIYSLCFSNMKLILNLVTMLWRKLHIFNQLVNYWKLSVPRSPILLIRICVSQRLYNQVGTQYDP